ncbi:LamG-like jellyroll fold domain-containing protein [Streptomyces sp. NPDC001832]|uniref:LamG-like jellyroll fold domain-containing protein n=1 Tax=Streptomyces sp. NPDC001832 TaxID=3154527 RepID=UPI00331A1621
MEGVRGPAGRAAVGIGNRQGELRRDHRRGASLVPCAGGHRDHPRRLAGGRGHQRRHCRRPGPGARRQVGRHRHGQRHRHHREGHQRLRSEPHPQRGRAHPDHHRRPGSRRRGHDRADDDPERHHRLCGCLRSRRRRFRFVHRDRLGDAGSRQAHRHQQVLRGAGVRPVGDEPVLLGRLVRTARRQRPGGRWTFGRPDKDGTGAAWTESESTALTTAQLGVPVMLTVVYDAQAATDPEDTSKLGALRLYVDSALMGDDDGVPYSTPWQGGGAFEIGRAKINGAAARYFPGKIDSVRVWAGVTSTDTIANRHNIEQR